MTNNRYPVEARMPTNEILEEHRIKDKNEEQLLTGLLELGTENGWTDREKAWVESAYALTKVIHREDTHRGLPYTYHLLRNANRVAQYLHITDPEVITAIILHDGVEDHPKDLVKVTFLGTGDQILVPMDLPDDPMRDRELALEHISVLFSPRIAHMVDLVSNYPEQGETPSYEEFMAKYAAKVEIAVEEVDGWLVKFPDWVDNGLGIVHSGEEQDPEKRLHFSRKYGMVHAILENRFAQDDIQELLDPIAKEYVRHQFKLGLRRLDTTYIPFN